MNSRIRIITILSFSLLLISHYAKAQEYLPFPQDSATWYSAYSYPWPHPPYVYYTTYKFETLGDTIINGVEYTKLYSCDAFEDSFPNYRGAYRVEIDSNKVYYIEEYSTTESLLYDFAMSPGDTITTYQSGYPPFELICLDTSTLILNGIAHKELLIYSYLDNGTECYTVWVRGIGSLRMPIETNYFCASSFEWAYDLSCYYYKGNQVYYWYENPFFEGCAGTNEYIGIDMKEIQNSFSVIPNPVKSVSRLKYPETVHELFDYRIFNENGIVVQSESGIFLPSISIIKNDFSPGIYIIQLNSYSANQVFTTKFIVL